MVGRMTLRAAARSSATQTLSRATSETRAGSRPASLAAPWTVSRKNRTSGSATRALHDRTVRQAARDPTSPRPLRRHVDRQIATGRREVEAAVREADLAALHRHRFPGEEPADQLDGLADGHGRAARVHAQLAEAAHAGADAEHRAPVRDLVERGDGHGRQRGVSRIRVGHAGAEADAPRAQRAERQARVDLAEEPLVREPEVVVARALRELGERGQSVGRVGRQQQESRAQRHVAGRPRGRARPSPP